MLSVLFPALAQSAVSQQKTPMPATSEAGWVAHSAYGLQLSVPNSWHVAYFQNCPDGNPGNLLIGTPLVYAMCVNFPESLNMVTMQPEKSEAWLKNKSDRRFEIHGLHVTSETDGYLITWAIPSKSVVITASGNHGSAVLHTLARASATAQPALGILKGTENLQGATTVPVTGLVAVTRLETHGPELPPARSYAGEFTDTLPPGRYRLTGHDGNALCATVSATVVAGSVTNAPPINCQGM
jgi:hypothetical protein